MADAGFCMHKFKSNHPKLLNGGGTTSVLGVPWNLDSDNLYFAQKFSIDENSTCFTKRSLLKFIGSIFDPLGMISPLTVSMRLLFRNLWKEKYDWDQPLPKEFVVMIEKFYELYKCLKNLSIPRFLGCLSTGKIMLFGFCDASMQAIGCVFYVVSCFESCVVSNFLCSKARLAPLKETITIPRLELLSCLLLTNLYVAIKPVLPDHTLHCYSDSMCSLSWIRNIDKTWKPYIQSRVDIIRRYTDINQWYFVKGESNPADLITRFDDSLKFETFKRWYDGPIFLKTLELPMQPSIFLPDQSEEIKCLSITSTVTDPIPSLDIERFSKYTIVIRTIARILRLFRNSVQIFDCMTDAETLVIKKVQAMYFPQLFKDIDGNRKMNITVQLRLFILNGIIYTATRLPTDATILDKLILLPTNSKLTELIIRHFHEKLKHSGLGITLANIRSRFWIPKGRNVVRKMIAKCVHCRKIRGKAFQLPIAPKLPGFRVRGAAFETVGVDYAGPITVDIGKIYILLFTCAVTRALHLELTPDLTTDHFLMAFQRFIARRGTPSKIVSDNAKTFVAAAEYFKNATTLNLINPNSITWQFNCPLAPWWGGFFERMVGLVKDLLRKTVSKYSLQTYHEFQTNICMIEGILNSRPLCYVSQNDTDLVLTPNHLISGGCHFKYKNPSENELVSLHNLQNKFLKEFYELFRKQYLTELIESHKSSSSFFYIQTKTWRYMFIK